MDSPTTIENQTPKEKPVVISSDGPRKNPFKYSLVNPKFLGAMTVMLLLVGGVGTGVYLIQRPQQTISQASLSPVTMNLQPVQIETQTGAEFTVDVFSLAGNNQITSVDLNLDYDPEVLVLQSITPKDFLPKILVPPKIASGSASVSLGTEGTSGVSGSGVIATLLFKVMSTTTQTSTTINFDSGKSQIKVLNRDSGNSGDTFGKTQVTIAQLTSAESPSTTQNPSASSASAEPQSSENSDFNNDGQTNSIDISLMYSAWGDPETETQQKADLNGDGTVNGMDYSSILPKLRR